MQHRLNKRSTSRWNFNVGHDLQQLVLRLSGHRRNDEGLKKMKLLSFLFIALLAGCNAVSEIGIQDAIGGGIIGFFPTGAPSFTNTKSVSVIASGGDYMDCKNIAVTTNITVCFWGKANTLVSSGSAITKWSASTGERSIVVQSQDLGNSQLMQVLLSGNGTTVHKNYRGSQTVWSTSAWNQFCFTFAGGSDTLSMYGNRTLDSLVTKVSDTSLGGAIFNSSVEYYVGAVRRNAGGSIAGTGDFRIDHLSIWNTALDATGITNTASGGKPADLSTHANVANLTNWWKLGDSPDAISTNGILDSVGTSHCNPVNMTSSEIVTDVP